MVKPGRFLQLSFEISHRAFHVHLGDPPASGANEVIMMVTGPDENEIHGPLMKSELPDHAVSLQFHQQAVNGRGIALLPERGRLREFGYGHRLFAAGHFPDEQVERPGAAQPPCAQPFRAVVHKGIDLGFCHPPDMPEITGLKSKKKNCAAAPRREHDATRYPAMNRQVSILFASLLLIPLVRASDEEKKSAAPAGEKEIVELPRVAAGDLEGVRKLVGKKAVVFGKVVSAREVEASGISFLDMDGGKFTVVCWKESYSKFEGGKSPASLYKGQDIEVTGEIFEYRGKNGKGSPQPEIKLTEPSQINVVTAAREGDDKDKTRAKPAAKSGEKKEDPKKVESKKYFK